MPLPPRARQFNTTAGCLPPDRDDPDTFPVVVLAGFRIGAFITDEGSVYIGVDSEFADPALRSPDTTIPVEVRIDSHPSQFGRCAATLSN
ncbi:MULTISPECIES: hypothetical protein [unclassified Streptomyces]|uniref:hypothetical protein n=1 Tax=unclassified Streptomyces TaxID=2593676 RepID=UPI00081D9C6E|nr:MULTISPECIES: hypothetical protein [unclassified Streptomyces]MYZ40906.1 hypothetical protein [Streptomyces sp. SID4917]SCG08922.1 hypothetical protein GA0115259_114052 [Streptomyces sp. MnatMP-M17]